MSQPTSATGHSTTCSLLPFDYSASLFAVQHVGVVAAEAEAIQSGKHAAV